MSAQQQANLRSYLSQQLGIDLSSYQDDMGALGAIRNALGQVSAFQQKAQHYDRIAPYFSEFQEYLRSRGQQQASPQQQQQQGWWSVPEWKQEWADQVEPDPDNPGRFRPKVGFDPILPQKIEAYKNWQRETMQKLLTDPIGTLAPGLEQFVQPIIQKYMQSFVQNASGQQATQRILTENSHWIFQTDQSGQVLRNPMTGQPEKTLAGQIYTREVQKLHESGVYDPRVQHELAKNSTLGQLMQMQMADQRGQQAGAQQQAAPQLQGTGFGQTQPNGLSRIPSPSPATPGTTTQEVPVSLEDLLRQNFEANGITDQQVRATLQRRLGQ
ncbi:MAG: hypothetical protein HC888_00765 [Candidatus Competibacteraceae bacterium]|nr:hypothetical protein [Candidatus Competibacteraceae bacterium]